MKEYLESLKKVSEKISDELGTYEKIGLGSGSTISELLKLIKLNNNKTLIPSSLQIELVVNSLGLKVSDLEGPVDIYIDGADQVDAERRMIKGGGGALLKEKVIMQNSNKTYIFVSENKLSSKLCMNNVPVPVEVFRFCWKVIKERLAAIGGKPVLRCNEKGYPIITESNNLIFDTYFDPIDDPEEMERKISSIKGVAEVGIFTIKPEKIFVLKRDGNYDVL